MLRAQRLVCRTLGWSPGSDPDCGTPGNCSASLSLSFLTCKTRIRKSPPYCRDKEVTSLLQGGSFLNCKTGIRKSPPYYRVRNCAWEGGDGQ